MEGIVRKTAQEGVADKGIRYFQDHMLKSTGSGNGGRPQGSFHQVPEHLGRGGDLRSVQRESLVTQEGLRLSPENCWPSQQQCWLAEAEEETLTFLSETGFHLELCNRLKCKLN